MPNKLEYYRSIMAEDIKNDSDCNKTFAKIDDMWNNKWSLPEPLGGKDWLRAFKTTAPHDAMLAATRVFAKNIPSVSVLPLAPNDMAREDAEAVEALLDWHLFRTLKRGVDSPLWKMVENAVRYSYVCFQTEYLPKKSGMSGKSWDAARRFGDFAFVNHSPHNVHARYTPYALESVSLGYQTNVLDIVRQFGKDNPGVKKLIAKLGDKPDVWSTTGASYYDYTDYDDRVRWVALSEQFDERGGSELFEIERKELALPFMNWVIRKDDHPLMKSVVDADLWDNANVLESLRYYLVIATVAQARSWSRTPSGEGVDIDHSEPGAQARMRSGEEFGMLPPAALDQNVNVLIESVRGDIRQTTVAQALTTLEQLPGGTPFATINAILQAALSSLAPVQSILEDAITDSLYQMLRWSQYAQIPLSGKRRITSTFNKVEKEAGADIQLSPDEFSPDDMYIRATIHPDSPTDKQARIEQAILLSRNLPIAPKKAMEDSGIEYSDADVEEYLSWNYLKGEHEADIKKILGQADLEIQQKMAAAQQPQADPQAEIQKMNSMGAEGGFDTRQGGSPPAMSNPNMTREKVTGKDMSE